MFRLNRYAFAGSVIGLLPNPFTRVDLSTPLGVKLIKPTDGHRPAGGSSRPPIRPGTPPSR